MLAARIDQGVQVDCVRLPGEMRIFLSYGHDEYTSIAARLKADFQQAGHEVWFDVDRLLAGADWGRYIEEGIEWASIDPASSRFLLLMTPHSVRRPDGFCLRELSRALDRQLTIIPAMLATCEPPLSIANLQWLDMRDAAALGPSNERLQRAAEQLIRVLESQAPLFDSSQERLLRRLDPDEFRHDITARSSSFVGREWIDHQVDQWLRSPSADPVFWLTAPPGFGKTALAVHLFSVRPDVAALYLCVHGNSRKTDPRRVVKTIAYQLTTQLPDYRTRLNQLPLEDLTATANAAGLFDTLIAQPLAEMAPPPAPVLVIVDALDEATARGENPLAQLVATEFSKAPTWLRFLVTSRPDEPEVTFPLQGLNPVRLDDDSGANEKDLRQFVRERLLSKAHEANPAIVDAIVAKSEGLFLYVVLWLDAELENTQTLTMEKVAEFPQGLAGVYAHFFKRQFTDIAAYKKQWRPVLEIVVDAFEPLPLETFARLFNWSEYDLGDVPSALGSLFPVSDSRIRPFHRSVIEWIGNAAKAGPYFVSRGRGHVLLADAGWNDYVRGADQLSDYFVRFLANHLAANRDWARMAPLIMDPSFTRRVVDASGYAYLLDYYKEWPVAEAIRPIGDDEWRLHLRVADSARRLGNFRGRRAETEQIERALDAPGAAVLLGGESGVGKTLFLLHLYMRDFRKHLCVHGNPFDRTASTFLDDVMNAISERISTLDQIVWPLDATLDRQLAAVVTVLVSNGFDALLLDDYDTCDAHVALPQFIRAAARGGLKLVVTCRSDRTLILSDCGEWTAHVELPPMTMADIRSAIEEMLARHNAPRKYLDAVVSYFDDEIRRQPFRVVDTLRIMEEMLAKLQE